MHRGYNHQQQQHSRAQVLAAAASTSSNGNGTTSSSALPAISVIASDVDGTLLNSQQQLTPGVEAAVRAAADAGVPVSGPLCMYVCVWGGGSEMCRVAGCRWAGGWAHVVTFAAASGGSSSSS
jgi:hypothetical protein